MCFFRVRLARCTVCNSGRARVNRPWQTNLAAAGMTAQHQIESGVSCMTGEPFANEKQDQNLREGSIVPLPLYRKSSGQTYWCCHHDGSKGGQLAIT